MCELGDLRSFNVNARNDTEYMIVFERPNSKRNEKLYWQIARHLWLLSLGVVNSASAVEYNIKH